MVRRSGRCMAAALVALVLRVEARLGRFPVPSVEKLDRELGRLVETIGIDAPSFGMGARLVKALNAAMPAEQVLGAPRAEAVTRKRIVSAKQAEPFVRHHHVDETGHPADGAIAVERGHGRIGQIHLEPHRPTMASALNLHMRSLRTLESAGKKEGLGHCAAATETDPPRLARSRLSARAFPRTSTRHART